MKKLLLLLAIGLTVAFVQRDWAKSTTNEPVAKAVPPKKAATLTKASTLPGIEVYNKQNDPLGEIKDVMLNIRNGRVPYAVLATGGFLGMGDKLIALPPTALSATADGKRLILQADKESLRAAPGFEKNNWPAMAETKWLNERDQHYVQHADSRADDSITEAAGAEKQAEKGESTNVVSLPAPANLKLSQLLGMKVQDGDKHSLGEVKDAAIDLENGQIRYLVLHTGQKWIAIAPQLFRQSDSPRTLVVTASADAFKNAEGFDPAHWPEESEHAFGNVNEAAGTPLDPKSDGRTALDQSNSRRDLMITQQLRRSMMMDKSMSTLTRNITIITADGVITVRGTVGSQQDVDRIVAFAREIAGNKVVNELKIKNPKGQNQ